MDIEKLFDELWPICRSITGKGLRQSLNILGKIIPLKIHSVPSNTKIFDWVVPKEWEIKDATLIGPDGIKYCDFKETNLSVLHYSAPIKEYKELEELQNFLHSIPEIPEAIPYVTSFYQKNWGFCLSDSSRKKMPKGLYECKIDSELFDGELNYGEYLLEGGKNKKEILISTYLCHPSLANNELSGTLVMAGLFEKLKNKINRRFNYRFYVGPETIGSLCFLNKRGNYLKENMNFGIVLTCLGGNSTKLSAKLPRNKNHYINKFLNNQDNLLLRDFTPTGGSDERQFCSPGFDLPVINIVRDCYVWGYKGYHNSLDTKEYMNLDSIDKSINRIEKLLDNFEESFPFQRTNPYGEPQLGKRNLYANINSRDTWNTSTDDMIDSREFRDGMLWILSMSDGENDLNDISLSSGINPSTLKKIAHKLMLQGLII